MMYRSRGVHQRRADHGDRASVRGSADVAVLRIDQLAADRPDRERARPACREKELRGVSGES